MIDIHKTVYPFPYTNLQKEIIIQLEYLYKRSLCINCITTNALLQRIFIYYHQFVIQTDHLFTIRQ